VIRTLHILFALTPLVISVFRDRRRWLFWGQPLTRSPEFHRVRARRIVARISALGPTFVKLAQVFASRADLIPEPYIGELGTLVDAVPTSIESFPWPKVLTDISWNQVELKPNGDVTTGGTPSQYSSWSITPMFIDEYHGLTKVTERYYISNVPFDESIITAESLHPTNVHWELGGSNGNGAVTNCLTGGITTPAIVASGSSTVIRASTTFDATPQTAWVEHIFYDVVTRQNGLYFRLTKTAAPPPHTPGQS